MYLYDRVAGFPKLVSHVYGSQEFGYGGVERPSITPDGRFMTYASSSILLVPGFIFPEPELSDPYPGMNVYLYDRLLDKNYLISHKAGAAVDRRQSVEPVPDAQRRRPVRGLPEFGRGLGRRRDRPQTG